MNQNNIITLKDILLFVKEAIKFIFKKWFLISLFGLVGGVIGFFYAKSKKPIFISQYSFILNENESGSSLNLSSLAGITGLAGLAGGTNVNEDKLLYIANSRQIIGLSLTKECLINNANKSLLNHFIDIYNLQSGFKSDTSLEDFQYFKSKKVELFSYQENKVLDIIKKCITENKMLKIDTKKKSGIVIQSAGIITLEFSSIDENFSKYFIESLYENLSKYYSDKTIQRQSKNYNLIKERADSIKNLLFEKDNSAANIFDKNLRVVKMTGKLDLERTKRDIQILSLMYGEVLKNLEIAKFALDNQTPFFQPIDMPTLPLEIKKLSKLIVAIIGSLIFGILSSLVLIYKNIEELRHKATQ